LNINAVKLDVVEYVKEQTGINEMIHSVNKGNLSKVSATPKNSKPNGNVSKPNNSKPNGNVSKNQTKSNGVHTNTNGKANNKTKKNAKS